MLVQKAQCPRSHTDLSLTPAQPTNECIILGSGQMGPCLFRAGNLEQKAHTTFHIIVDLPEVALLLCLQDEHIEPYICC